MSFKVYTGSKLDGVSTLEEASNFVNSIRPKIRDIISKQAANDIKKLACLMYDLNTVGVEFFDENDSTRVPLLAATMRYIESSNKDRNTEYSVALAVVDGHTLAIPFFNDNKECYELFLNHPQVSNFAYWDNSDHDPNVSKKEWALRKRLWSKLFKDNSVPNQAMFIMVVGEFHYFIPLDQHMEGLPSLQSRIDACAGQMAWKEIFNTYEINELSVSKMIGIARELTPQYIEQIKDKLNSNLKLTDLEKEIPEGEVNES